MFVLIFVSSLLVSIGFKFWMIETAFGLIGRAEICSFIVSVFLLERITGSCFRLYPNLGINGETWHNQLLVPSNAGSIEKDFDGNPLHDFREIPSCVIRRKQGKHRAGPRLEAVDLTSEFVIGKSIHADLDRLAGPNSTQLGFFEVGYDPIVICSSNGLAFSKRRT
jgi:hypothetical protein